MKIAYIVLCHKDPELLKRLGMSLQFDNDKLFVHVDKKTSLYPFQNCCRALQNVVFVSNRIKNYWGGV